MMNKQLFCQSCGMPFSVKEPLYGTNSDGSLNREYCMYCFKGGCFTEDMDMEEMIQRCLPHMLTANQQMTKEKAVEMMRSFFPSLKRWQSQMIQELFCEKARYLTLDGKGDPNASAEYGEALQALYAVFFALQKDWQNKGKQLLMPPPHTLWWAEEGKDSFKAAPSEWLWRAMLEIPVDISEGEIEMAKQGAAFEGNAELLDKMTDREMNEGNVLQVLHIGSYNKEGVTIKKLYEYARKKGYQHSGPQHDIYFDDPGQTPPEECRALIRLPISKGHEASLVFTDEKKII